MGKQSRSRSFTPQRTRNFGQLQGPVNRQNSGGLAGMARNMGVGRSQQQNSGGLAGMARNMGVQPPQRRAPVRDPGPRRTAGDVRRQAAGRGPRDVGSSLGRLPGPEPQFQPQPQPQPQRIRPEPQPSPVGLLDVLSSGGGNTGFRQRQRVFPPPQVNPLQRLFGSFSGKGK